MFNFAKRNSNPAEGDTKNRDLTENKPQLPNNDLPDGVSSIEEQLSILVEQGRKLEEQSERQTSAINSISTSIKETESQIERIRQEMGLGPTNSPHAVQNVAGRLALERVQNNKNKNEVEIQKVNRSLPANFFDNNSFDNNVSNKENTVENSQQIFIGKVEEEIATIATDIEKDAIAKGVENTSIYGKRKDALEEAKYKLIGAVSPNPLLKYYKSIDSMISYSRRNEDLARKVFLADTRAGMICWYDNQESNTTSYKTDEDDLSYEDRLNRNQTKAIGLGGGWEGSISKGIPKDGYIRVLLTHDTLDKFDVISQEIIKSQSKGKQAEILAICVDDERGSILERLRNIIEDKGAATDPETMDYVQAIRYLEQAIKLETNIEEMKNITLEELEDKMIKKTLERTNIPKDLDINTKYMLPDMKLDDSLVNYIEKLESDAPGKDVLEKEKYARSIREAKLIIESQTDPKKLIGGDGVKLKYFTFINEEVKEKYEGVGNSFKALGAEEVEYGVYEKDGKEIHPYAFWPITAEDLESTPIEEYPKKFGNAFMNSAPYKAWIFPNDENFYHVLEKELTRCEKEMGEFEDLLNKNLLTEGKLPHPIRYYQEPLMAKLICLRRMATRQGLLLKNSDLKDAEGVGSYLILKEAMLKSELNYLSNKEERESDEYYSSHQ